MDELFLINETLVEKLFDTFDTDADLTFLYRYDNFKDIEQHLMKILQKFGISLEFRQDENLKSVGGVYQVEHKRIIIFLPLKKDIYLEDIIDRIFHEYSHEIRENSAPGKFNPTEKNNKNYFKAPEFKWSVTASEYNMLAFIKNVTQSHERSSFAFTIAYDFCKSFGYQDNLIKLKVKEWEDLYKAEHNEKILEDRPDGIKIAFYLSVYYSKLKQLKYRNLERVKPLIIDLFQMTIKYYKRVAGTLKIRNQNNPFGQRKRKTIVLKSGQSI
jgi:hypothetical protein